MQGAITVDPQGRFLRFQFGPGATIRDWVEAREICLRLSEQTGIRRALVDVRRQQVAGPVIELFESPEGFPGEYLRSATNVMVIKIRKSQARCDFEDIPPGTYAMAVVHDENMNGKLDTNWAGVPTEGYGFSNNAKGVLGAPSFAAASFNYDGRNVDLTMSLRY